MEFLWSHAPDIVPPKIEFPAKKYIFPKKVDKIVPFLWLWLMIIPLCIFILRSMYIRMLFPTLMSYVPKLYPKLVKTFCCCFLQEVPEIPGNFDLVGHSSRQANLSWNLPYDGQSPLLAFQLEFQRTNAGKGGIYLVVKYIHTIINT